MKGYEMKEQLKEQLATIYFHATTLPLVSEEPQVRKIYERITQTLSEIYRQLEEEEVKA